MTTVRSWRPILALGAGCIASSVLGAQSTPPCAQHSRTCPAPAVVAGVAVPANAQPPSDAIVLFNGGDLAAWRSADGTSARWQVRDGYMEVAPGAGAIQTARAFGDVQLHVEWASPTPADGTDQDRGNSGVFLMGRYEVQVLDSYGNVTYPDGQAGAVYGQYPPLVNASRPPGEWQSFDIVFHRPRFDASGALLRPATMTVLHNGVLIQDAVALTGPTANGSRPPFAVHPDRLPISLQDHGHRVRYRNIWLRELEAR